jgi:hypothetical protein
MEASPDRGASVPPSQSFDWRSTLRLVYWMLSQMQIWVILGAFFSKLGFVFSHSHSNMFSGVPKVSIKSIESFPSNLSLSQIFSKYSKAGQPSFASPALPR